MTNRNPIQWGQQRTFAEPNSNQPAQAASYASLTPAVVRGAIDDGAERQQEIPDTRDWTVYYQLQTDDPTRLLAPFVLARVRYGSGSSSFERIQRVPVVGCVMHVVATWLDVEATLYPSGIPGAGNVGISAYVSPGRPITQRIPVADSIFSSPLVYRVPPFATGLVAAEADNAGVGTLPCIWQYNGINRGQVGATPTGAWSSATGVPQDADTVRVFPTRNNLNLWWEAAS